jgi:hypothetical protein
MPDKHTPYFELRDALLAGGCPMCRLGERSATHYIESVLYEGMTDPPIRQRLRTAQGLCRQHAWQMTRMRASVLGTAIIYRDVLNDLIVALEAQPEAPGGFSWGRRVAKVLPEPQMPCPACTIADEEAARVGDVLRSHLSDSEIAAVYARAGGLCLPHLRLLLARSTAQQAVTLRTWHLAVCRELRGQLDELIRKHDYRFQGESIGSEADASRRAIACIVGERETDA